MLQGKKLWTATSQYILNIDQYLIWANKLYGTNLQWNMQNTTLCFKYVYSIKSPDPLFCLFQHLCKEQQWALMALQLSTSHITEAVHRAFTSSRLRMFPLPMILRSRPCSWGLSLIWCDTCSENRDTRALSDGLHWPAGQLVRISGGCRHRWLHSLRFFSCLLSSKISNDLSPMKLKPHWSSRLQYS